MTDLRLISTYPQPKKAKEVKEAAVYTGNTQPGERKDLAGQFPDAYSPQYVEAAWYSWWEKEGFFTPEFGVSQCNAGHIYSIARYYCII